MKNSPELEALGAITHHSAAVGWGLVVAGGALALGSHRLGVPYNRARGNTFEERFHQAALVVAGSAIGFGLVAIGVDALAAAAHRRDAR